MITKNFIDLTKLDYRYYEVSFSFQTNVKLDFLKNHPNVVLIKQSNNLSVIFCVNKTMDIDMPLSAIINHYGQSINILSINVWNFVADNTKELLNLSYFECEYLKLVAVDENLSEDFISFLLNKSIIEVDEIKACLIKNGILILGTEINQKMFENVIYYNPYPISKNANLLQVYDALIKNPENKISCDDSKLWYLNEISASSYLTLHTEQEYFETMKGAEKELNENIVEFIKSKYPSQRFEIIDIGSGNGLVGLQICKLIGADKINAYYSVDVSEVEQATVLKNHHSQPYKTVCVNTCFENLDNYFPLKKQSNVIQIYIFYGGTYGNFYYKDINQSLAKVLKEKNSLLIIETQEYDIVKQKNEIIKSYTNSAIEKFTLGEFLHFGCKKEDFKIYPDSNLRIGVKLEGDRCIIYCELKNAVTIREKHFNAGCKIDGFYSRKIDYSTFKSNLSESFEILDIKRKDTIQIALVSTKIKSL